jgi:DNA mismatch repair protein MutS2
MSLKHTDLSMVAAGEGGNSVNQSNSNLQGGKPRLSKSVERALMSEGRESRLPQEDPSSNRSSSPTMRMASNTVDVRGCNLEEAQSKVRDMVSKCLMNGQSTIYVLHGHGSGGVLKTKLREWLKSEKQLVKKWAPAEQADGGDAFTLLLVT